VQHQPLARTHCGRLAEPPEAIGRQLNGVTLTGGTPVGPNNGGFANPTARPDLGLNAHPPYTVAFLAGPDLNVTTWYNQSNECHPPA